MKHDLQMRAKKSAEEFSLLLNCIHESLTVKFTLNYKLAHINLSYKEIIYKLKCIQTL